jgi:release factor glutamine methyltransferase
VPRPDTETVIEGVRAARPERAQPYRILDLCTGSGAIAVSLAKEYPAAQVIATEISPAAAAIARRNAARNGVADRVDVREGDLFAPVAGAQFDLIVANPPYIATAVIATLASEVRREPVIALDGGRDGLAFYDRICREAGGHLAIGGSLIVEHGYDQADAVHARFVAAGLGEIALVRDLGKNPRVTWGTTK